MKNIHSNFIPVNKVAASVFFKGEEYIPNKIITTKDSELPLDTAAIHGYNKNMVNLTGMKVGRFTVIGKYKHGKGWVVKCACGVYTIRQKKAIVNKDNVQDRCEHCKQLLFMKRYSYRKSTGIDKDIREF